MAEENINIYLSYIQKIINSGNPKYMSYISKEYMKYVSSSPIIAETIESMIHKNVNINPQSPYSKSILSNGFSSKNNLRYSFITENLIVKISLAISSLAFK